MTRCRTWYLAGLATGALLTLAGAVVAAVIAIPDERYVPSQWTTPVPAP